MRKTSLSRMARRFALVSLLVSAVPAVGDSETSFLLRYAVLLGDQKTELLTPASGLASTTRLSELLLDWDPATDDAELRELLALKGLHEMARQAVELPKKGGESRGVFYVKDQRLDIEIALTPREELEYAEFEVLIYLDGELISAPRIITPIGEHATITTRKPDASMLFLVVEADRLNDAKAEPASQTQIERIDGIPLVDGERVTPPKALEQVAHEYTDAARQARVQGVVVLRLRIDEDGRVRDAAVLKSLPFGLDEAAIEAASGWRFEPPEVDGKTSEVLYRVAFQFRLQDEPVAE